MYLTVAYYTPDETADFDPAVTNIVRITRGPATTFEAETDPHLAVEDQVFTYQSTHRVTDGVLTPLAV